MRTPILSPLDTGGAYPGKLTWTVEAWNKNVGDSVPKDFELVEVVGDKATTIIASPASGILTEICVPKDEWFECNPSDPEDRVVLGYIGVPDGSESGKLPQDSPTPPIPPDGAKHIPAQPSRPPQEMPPDKPLVKVTPVAQKFMQVHGISLTDLLVFLGAPSPQRIRKEDVLRYVEHLAAHVPEQRVPTQSGDSSARLRIAPPARAKMRELGMREEDLRSACVQGTGAQGTSRAEDIEAYHAGRNVQPNKPIDRRGDDRTHLPVDDGAVVRIEPGKKRRTVSTVQKVVASHIAEGWEKPTAQPSFRCDFSDVVAFRKERAKAFEGATGVKLQLAFPLVAAIARVLGRGKCGTCTKCLKNSPCDVVWRFNGYWDKWGEEKADRPGPAFMEFANANLGIAFNTPSDDLVILTAPDANTKSLPELARVLAGLQQKAQERTYTRADVTGYSFIFNNVGGLQALVPPELRGKIVHVSGYSLLSGQISALLNLGALDEHGQGMVQISFDHRIISGGHAMRFLVAVFKEMLERVLPELRELCDEHT